MIPKLHWYCRTCGANAQITSWDTRLTPYRGQMYVCKTCGRGGYLEDPDAPVQVTEEEMAQFWYQLQNDECWHPDRSENGT